MSHMTKGHDVVLTYYYSCECGKRVYAERQTCKRDDPVNCACGALMERMLFAPKIVIARGESHHDYTDEEWDHYQDTKESNEWLTAYGAADGETLNGPKSAQMDPAEVAEKRRRIAAGEKPPEELTWDKIMPHERHLYQTYDQYIGDTVAQAQAAAS